LDDPAHGVTVISIQADRRNTLRYCAPRLCIHPGSSKQKAHDDVAGFLQSEAG
jgi:hypothetical protein